MANKTRSTVFDTIRNKIKEVKRKRNLRRGCHLCTRKNCSLCTTKNKHNQRFMMTGDFIATKTNQTHKIEHHLTCSSNWIIYMLICINCGIRSFGSSKRTARTRILEHIRAIAKNKDGHKYPMVRHLNRLKSECYGGEADKLLNLRCMVVDGLDAIDEANLGDQIADGRLNKKEIYWQGISLSFLNGNDRSDFNNRGYNRRNYTDKKTHKLKTISLSRTLGMKDRNWNANWCKVERLIEKKGKRIKYKQWCLNKANLSKFKLRHKKVGVFKRKKKKQ
eukprot:284163_1